MSALFFNASSFEHHSSRWSKAIVACSIKSTMYFLPPLISFSNFSQISLKWFLKIKRKFVVIHKTIGSTHYLSFNKWLISSLISLLIARMAQNFFTILSSRFFNICKAFWPLVILVWKWLSVTAVFGRKCLISDSSWKYVYWYLHYFVINTHFQCK